MISHSKDQFKKNLKNQKNFILFSEFKISNSDPTQFFIEYAKNKNYGFLFESVEKEVLRGRYTICGHTPQIIIKDDKKKLYILTSKSSKSLKNKNPLTEIEKLIKNLKFNNSNKVPHMSSAFFGYFGYETIHYVEKISRRKKKDDLMLPNSILFLPKFIIIYDNKKNKITISSPVISKDAKDM
jgi:anthranilate/para-aminobenzoate synthase component I